ncbi:pol II transcription elongation factor [Ephemerocybe angulata]|uniref:Elongator complex protein 1 n=1 Tax=Ephemerocybe angulata TaxID=980116 RepID=A0A8H6IB83_9AGAR|nr:pol II transcription elongation factor [Tulosesus angulatus]
MRNLSLVATEYDSLSYANAHITATAFDLDENSSLCSVEVELWRIMQNRGPGTQTPPVATSMFTSMASSNEPEEAPQIVSFRVLAESRKIAAILRGGDVVMVSFDEEDSPAEVEGSFESGILAASWCPDESLLVIITGEQKLILMTSTFDVLSENYVHPSEFGEAPINVKVGQSPDEDTLPRISWRGDAAYFVVSSLAPADSQGFRRRILRVYDREATLQSTSEAVGGLEHTLCWRPSGNLIASTQRFGFEGGGSGREGRHDIVFFERNGLRHGEFSLKPEHFKPTQKVEKHVGQWGYRVRELVWSSDSNVLAIWAETDAGDIVQLWTTGNYHWYLKHEIIAPQSAPGLPGRFTSVQWHPESTLHLILTTPEEIIQRHYDWETYASPSKPPQDSGLVAVLDAASILLTPFRTQNVPPPMSSCQLTTKASSTQGSWSWYEAKNPVHVSFSQDRHALATLWEDGHIQLWALNTRIGPGPGKVMNPIKIWEGSVSDSGNTAWRQLSIRNDGTWSLTALGTSPSSNKDLLQTIHLDDGKVLKTESTELPGKNCRVVDNTWPIVFQGPTGAIFTLQSDETEPVQLGAFPEFCLQVQTADNADNTLIVGLGKSGRLYTFVKGQGTRVLATNANSFTISSSFVVFTTTAHESKYAPVSELVSLLTGATETDSKDVPDQWTVRKLERGSRIVVAVPSTMSLVLQMPRGNLETINPRPLVMEVVTKDLSEGNYRKAFFSCRKHRLDLNVLVDHDQALFLERVPQFVEQIPEVDHLNLFLTLVARGTQSAEVVTKICDSIRQELEKKDMKKYINTILTAHVVKTPPDYESGLAELLALRETDQSLVEEAVKYIIFLVDAERLFDIALGMYDFNLVLMVAQHAQKDPREYLPFLKELRVLDKYYQRFRIDDHLKRHEKALRNLSMAGPERFDEAIAYVERYSLYEQALSIWKDTPEYKAVVEVYGDWLYERRELPQAASAFIEAGKPNKAMVAFEKNLQWRELFDLAFLDNASEEELADMAYRVSEDLASKKRYIEAGQVLLEYKKDVRGAVIYLVQGNSFSEARRISNLHRHPELTEEVIRPGSLDSRAQVAEDITEMREQARKQRNRIRELRIRKVEEPDAFYGTEDVAMQNIDVMTDVSMAPTAFTRYTVAPTSVNSRSSKKSSRSKRKAERKVSSGRKGTVDEEEYLLKSLIKLVDRFTVTRGEVRNLLPHLYEFGGEYREEGLSMQADVTEFEQELKETIEEVWTRPAEGDVDGATASAEDTWAARMAEVERNRHINPLDKVSKPEVIRADKWRINLYEL